MIIIHTQTTFVAPHRQKSKSSVAYVILEGKLVLSLYDKSGKNYEQILLDSSNPSANKIIRLSPQVFRSVQSLSEYVVFIEIAEGPFEDSDTIWMK